MEKESIAQPPWSECARKLRAIDDTMDVLSGKWKISIIARLGYKPMRYSELLREVQGISGKMLSRELYDLEINGLITREVSVSKPLAVTYKISEYGHSLKALTDCMAEWGLQHSARLISAAK